MLAAACRAEQVHADVRAVLDAISSAMPAEVPVEAANASPSDVGGVTEPDDQPDA